MTKELLQHFANDLWAKIKSLFLLKEEAVDGILVKQGWQVVESVTANNTIALPSLDSFDELCIEMYDADGVVVHNTTLRCETLLSENINSEYREILLDNIHNLQTYVTYNMADNAIIPSYYEGVVIDSTSTVTTIVYIKGSELVSTVKSSVIAYDGTESGLEATNVQDAIDEIRVKANPNVQDVSGVIAKTDAHIANTDNPHEVTKAQVGLGNVDNTSDADKPISTAQQSAIDDTLTASKEYTDEKVANLVGTAPETLDTLEEIAQVLADSEDVVEALNSAIGNKANQSDLDDLTSTVEAKANQSDLETLQGTVNNKANQSDLEALQSSVGTKAEQSDLETLQSNVGIKANQSDLDELSNIVDTKASQDDLTELQNTVNENIGIQLSEHTSNTSNPHGVTASQLGLGNVDNTSDSDKPVSTATQTALDLKANSSDLNNAVSRISANEQLLASFDTATNEEIDNILDSLV